MIGEVIAGRYRVVAQIGSGGGGDVFEAEDLELPRRVAIKFLSPAWSGERHLRQRFLREAEALSSLDHPHICTIYQTGETDAGRMFIAMAYYEGQDLQTRLAHGALEFGEAISWGISTADGMDKAHRKGFLHRDLKPGNIIITEDGVVKILDFGLAKLPDRTQVTETGTAMGTLAYAAPEQVRGEKVDTRADIYSLGVILYQMVTGVCPFAASGAAATLQMVLSHDVPPARKLRSDLPEALDSLIRRCMDRDRASRPASMEEVRDELISVLAGISPSAAAMHRAQHVDTTGVPLVRNARRKRVLVPVVLALVAAVVAMQFDAVRALVGLSGPVENRGGIIIPFRAEGEDQRLRLMTAGLWADLNDQAGRLADLNPELWVLPTPAAVNATMENARGRFGGHTSIQGVVRLDGGQMTLDLSATDASDPQVLTAATWNVPGVGPVVPDLLEWVSGAFDVRLRESDRRAIDPGTTTYWPAYEAYLVGLGALASGDTDRALEELGTAVRQDPDFALARLRYAEAMIERGDEVYLDRAESLLSTGPRPAALLAQNYALLSGIQSARGDADSATRMMKLALDHRPQNPEFRRQLFVLWWRQGDLEAAEAVCLDGMELNPGFYGTQEALAFVYYAQGRLQEAIEYFGTAIELAPDGANAYNTRGACYLQLEQFSEATEMFERSFALEGKPGPASNLGTLYYMQGRYELAADMFEFAIEYNPDDHILIGNRAAALRWIPGREEEMLELLDQAARMAEADLTESPGDGKTLAYLSGYYSMTQPEKSLEIAEQALLAAPEAPEVLLRIAVVYEETGHRTRALTTLESAIAHGQPMGQITNEPLLEDLRADPRYRLLLP